MNLNWKQSFKEKNSERLFEIFSETKRINIDPQIYAGNLLFERNYNVNKLKLAKEELINTIEVTFSRKHNKDFKKLKRETLIREIFFMTIIAVTVFISFYNDDSLKFELFNLTIDSITIAFITALIPYLPLLWIKKRFRSAIKKVEIEKEKKDKLIEKIQGKLNF